MGDGVDDAPLRALVAHFERFDATRDDELLSRCDGIDAVFTNKCRFDAATFEALPTLKFIGLTATGSDNIDLDAARAHNVAVTNITAYCTQSVVQHVFATLLSLTHKLPEYGASIANADWQRHALPTMLNFPIRELSGLTFGIIGYGELGKGVANVAEAFGMRVLVASRIGAAPSDGRVSLETVLAESDVISLHCPLNEITRHLINSERLKLMKSDAILINTARGGLVDGDALARALREKQLGGAAIDVLDQEPPPEGHPLLDDDIPNLMVTPHIAWAAIEARQRAIEQTAQHFRAFLNGERSNRID